MLKIYNVTLKASSTIRGIETIHALYKRNRTLICSQFQSLVRHKTQLCREINVPYRIDTKKIYPIGYFLCNKRIRLTEDTYIIFIFRTPLMLYFVNRRHMK